MKVFFKSTDLHANTHCCVCGQGFALSWERKPSSGIADLLFEIQKSLCGHHQDQKGPHAHPQSGVVIPVMIPEMSGAMMASASI
ncbi:MAG: hypothetical protein WBQ94_27000, partial [Terracidiphilus sp.]